MANQRQGNQYNPPRYKDPTPYNEPELTVGDPNRGNTGDPWKAQYASYGEPTPRGFHIQFQLLKHLPRAARLATNQYSGFPQWRSVNYGIVTPMQNLRTTGPQGAQPSNVANSGPVTDMAGYFQRG
jgi:hypothetical protein